MKRYKFLNLIFFIILSASDSSYAWNPFKTETYEDCILKNMKDAKNDNAVREIRQACRIKIEELKWAEEKSKKCESRLLTAEERKLLTGSAVVETYGFLKIRIYNGNKNITINGVKARLIDKETQKSFDFNLSNATVQPISTSGEMLAELLYAPKKWDWNFYDVTTEVCK